MQHHLRSVIASGLLAVMSSALAVPTWSAETAVPPTVLSKIAEGSDLSALWADASARAPVIVEFAMPQLADVKSYSGPAEADAAQIGAIHAIQDSILSAAFGSDLQPVGSSERVLKRMDFSPMFAITASAAELARFAADPSVLRIHEDTLSAPLLNQSGPLIGMPAGYSAGATGSGYHVAVLDTGARRSHEFLGNARIVSAACYSTTNADEGSTSYCPERAQSSTDIGSANDCDISIAGCGHGTHVSGIAAGFNTNLQAGEPTNGIARDARLITINVFSMFSGEKCRKSGGGSCVLSFESDQLRGLERVYALREAYQIASVNLSIGGDPEHDTPCDTDPLKPIIDQLRTAGIATVIAAGNSPNGNNTLVSAPSCISSAITVGSSTKQDARSSFSHWGVLIDVVAPGSDINSSYVSGASNTFYASLSGTSMAAPMVAGAFAALRTARPDATVADIEQALESTGTPITGTGIIAKPRIRVDRVLNAWNPPPVNDNFANRIVVDPSSTPAILTGNNAGATKEPGEPNHAGIATATTSVWWAFTPSISDQIEINTLGSTFNTVLAVYTVSPAGVMTFVAANDDFDGTPFSSVRFQGTAGTQYNIVVAGNGRSTGDIILNLAGGRARPANDDFANRIAILIPTTHVEGHNFGATKETGEPNHAGWNFANTSVWWSYTPEVSGPIEINAQHSGLPMVLAVYTGSSVSALSEVVSEQGRLVTFQGIAGTQYNIAVSGQSYVSERAEGPIVLFLTGGRGQPSLVAAVTPVARAAQVNSWVTAFATIINAGNGAAFYCSIAIPPEVRSTVGFSFSGRNPVTGAPENPDEPVNIPVGGQYNFLMSFYPAAAIQANLALVFDCADSEPAPSVAGLNTFLLTGTAGTAPADLVSIAVTATNNGIANVPLGGTGFAALAAINIGAGANLQARLQTNAIGAANNPLPITLSMCQTNPNTGACLAPASATVNFAAGANQTVTFSAFATSNGTPISFDPANKRLFVHFFQGTTPVGSASVAVRTAGNDASLAAAAAD